MNVSWVGEHISLGICVFWVGEHISLAMCVSWVGEHILEGLEGYFRDSGFDQNTVRESGRR